MVGLNDQSDQQRSDDLRQLPRVLTSVSDPSEALKAIVERARSLLDATSAGILLVEDPRIVYVSGMDRAAAPDDEKLHELAVDRLADVHVNPDSRDGNSGTLFPLWALRPIAINDQLAAVFWLSFDESTMLESGAISDINYAADCIAIATMNARVFELHERISRNQSEFMRIVAHDLRSPLTSIQGFASMLESGSVGDMNDRQTYFANKILSGIEQLTNLVDNFQDAGRFDPETGFYEMERSQCDLIDLAQSIIQSHILPAEKQELNITGSFGDDVPIIYADANMLERALTNLVDNAIKYTPNGSYVEVGVHKRNEDVVLSVHDNGYGISAENQELLFQRHVRVRRKEHKRVKGSGLGLFIVRSVARRHGGEAWVESEEGAGSTFYIRVPILEDENGQS